MSEPITEWRCTKPSCNRLLMKVRLAPGSAVEVICPKCGKKQALEVPRKAA